MQFKYWLLLLLCILDITLSKRSRKDHDPHVKRPENGTGTILISYDNETRHRNEKRILVVFDRICLDSIDEDDDKLMRRINHIREKYSIQMVNG